MAKFAKSLMEWFSLHFSNSDANKCFTCSAKSTPIKFAEKVGFCSERCQEKAYKRYQEYHEKLSKRECKFPGCHKKCYVEDNGYVHDFCDKTHAVEFKRLQVCKLSTCNQPCFTENGRVHDFCCKSHADEYHTWGFHASSHQPIQSHGYFTRRSTGPIHFYNRDELYYEFTNFALYRVMIDDKVWPTTEHYFQAQKFIGTPYMELIRRLPAPRLAFDFSRKPEVSHWRRNDWEQVKEKVMEKALWAKFTQHPVLYKMLLDTGNRRLVEHTSNDRYWGDGGDGSGKNRLGNLLMDVRQKLRQGNTSPPFSSQHVHVIEIHGNHPLHHEQLQGTSSTDLQLYKDGCDSQHSSSENLMSFDDSKLCNNTVFNSSDQHQLVTERILDSQQTAENSTNILQPLTASADYSTSVPPQPNSDQSTNTIDPTSIFIDASPGGGTGTIISSAEVLTNQSDPVTTTKPDTTLAGGKVQEDDTSTPMEVDENKIN